MFAEQTNTQNLLRISEARQNQLWQAYRDEALWANQSHENEESRRHALAVSALAFNQSLELADIQQDNQLAASLGGFGVNFLDSQLNDSGSFLSGLFSSPSSDASSGFNFIPSAGYHLVVSIPSRK